MATVLYIMADPKPRDQSRTFRISDEFIKAYKEQNPGDKVIELDLYKEGIDFLTAEGVAGRRPAPGEGRNHPVLKYAYQFLEADKYVFAAPLWNKGIPAILKAYFDYICVANVTFKYTEKGPVGLCNNKKAINITTRGGCYSIPPMSETEMGDKYLRNVCRFVGVEDYSLIFAEKLDVIGQDVEALVGKAIEEAKEAAKTF
jgi:FMN-dependent NADH-azoreductase